MKKDELARHIIQSLPDSNYSQPEQELIRLALIEYLKSRHKKSSLILEQVPPVTTR